MLASDPTQANTNRALELVDSLFCIGLGANLKNPLSLCQKAVLYIHRHPLLNLIAQSPFYYTEPVGGVRQSWYVNGVIVVISKLGTDAMLRLLQRIEIHFGRDRKREKRWGPRALDLDILFHGKRVRRLGDVILPHPSLHLRRFVLIPLADVVPGFVHPVFGKTVDTLLKEVDDRALVEPVKPSAQGMTTRHRLFLN